MIHLTASAITKLKSIIIPPQSLRIGVIGGGCSGYQYSMSLVSETGPMDKTFEQDGVKVVVDSVSWMYLNGMTIDYTESLVESGFKFINPNAKSTCGCGNSFAA